MLFSRKVFSGIRASIKSSEVESMAMAHLNEIIVKQDMVLSGKLGLEVCVKVPMKKMEFSESFRKNTVKILNAICTKRNVRLLNLVTGYLASLYSKTLSYKDTIVMCEKVLVVLKDIDTEDSHSLMGTLMNDLLLAKSLLSTENNNGVDPDVDRFLDDLSQINEIAENEYNNIIG